MADLYELRIADRIAALRLLLKALMLQRHLVKYNPNQPRAPAGRPDGGQWIDSHSSSKVAGPFNELNRAKCEAQYQSDEFQCTFAALARSRQACLEQARSRYTSCMKDLPIPDLTYYLG